jgi:cation/acetate symporter
MAIETQFRPLSPRIGTYYAIFVSAFIAMVLLLLILEQLGARKLWLSHVMMAAPVAFYLGVALAARTLDIHIFATAGRRIPAVFGGLSLATTAIGGIGYFALTGALFLIGFDALCIGLGIIGGLLVSSVLFSPFIRKSGSFTLASFLHQRFASTTLGAMAALFMIPPLVLLMVVELQLGAFVTSLFSSLSFEAAITVGAVVIVATATAGGLRSLVWTQSTQYIITIAGFLTPLVMLSVAVTNLPLPQFTYGELFERISTLELATGIGPAEPDNGLAMPGQGLAPAMKPFLQAFGAVSRFDFTLICLCVMAGIAALPSLVTRASASTSAFETRFAGAWAGLFAVLFLVSAPAYAAFTKFLTLQDVAGSPASQLPDWIGRLSDAGLADFSDKNGDGVIGAAELLVSRDGVALALPIIGGLPFIIVVLVAVGGVAVALAAATAHALTLGQAIGEDLYRGLVHPTATPSRRQFVARMGCILVCVLAASIAIAFELDALRAFAWALSLCAASFFPALTLSIWWDRASGPAVTVGMATGFGIALGHIILAELLGQGSLLGLSSMVAGVPGALAGAAVAVGLSLMQKPASGGARAYLDELRDPSGVALYDRAVRAAAKRRSL